jgi:very-short-patch-repair endonuclease
MTLPEVLLWNVLRTRPEGLKFRKQYPIGGYVADFACLACRLLIEVDGDNHSYGDRPQRDATRDRMLSALGYETLRVPAREVLKNMDGVFAHILNHCRNRPLHHDASRRGPPSRSGEDL